MEVKINREIRNYTESMFFGLSLRQCVFSVLAIAVAVGLYFLLRPTSVWRPVLGVCFGGGSLCRPGVHHLPRHDSRAVPLGLDSLGATGAEAAAM